MKLRFLSVATVATASVVGVALAGTSAATKAPTAHPIVSSSPTANPATSERSSVALSTLPSPANLAPLVSPALAGEGVYHPAGRTVQGHSAIFTTTIRPLDNASTVAGVAWIDPNLLSARLYSGSLSPGGFFWKYTAPVSHSAAQTLVAAFSGGFLIKDSHGGYLSEGHLVAPLANGAASLVIYRNGSITVGQWGRDVAMNANVVAEKIVRNVLRHARRNLKINARLQLSKEAFRRPSFAHEEILQAGAIATFSQYHLVAEDLRYCTRDRHGLFRQHEGIQANREVRLVRESASYTQ